MAKHKLFCVPGTWEAVAAANGDPGGITRGAEIAENIAHWAQTGELGPVNLRRLVKTGFDFGSLLRNYPHDKYGVQQIIPGWTALAHSANHLNFWGPRLPTMLDI